MLLGFVNDLTSDKTLDAQLLAVSDSGLIINSGVHPSITIDNLLHFLSDKKITPADYVAGAIYSKFEDSRLLTDIVMDGGIMYESLSDPNQGNTPATSTDDWLVTNIESLRIKVFLNTVLDRVKSDINLLRRQLDSQYLYNLIEQNRDITPSTPSGDYVGYSIEAKGSDYTGFTINQVALQATTATQQNLYVINQGQLIETIVLNPNAEGRLVFENIDRTYSGKGMFIFAIDSQDVLKDGGWLDPLKYDGFVPRTVSGTGDTPEDAIYSFGTGGNGLSLNITAHFEPSVYVEKNLKNFGKFIRSCFELQALTMFRTNANNRSNLQERTQMNEDQLKIEVMSLEHNTSASRYEAARKEAVSMLDKTDDREIENNDEDSITISLTSH